MGRNLEIAVSFEDVGYLIQAWFDLSISFARKSQNPELLEAIKKLYDFYGSACIPSDEQENCIKNFYNYLEEFEKKFGSNEQDTTSLRENLSYIFNG